MNTSERRARAALWSVRGVGPVTIRTIEQKLGPLGELLERPIRDWCDAVQWRGEAAQYVVMTTTLAARAELLEQRCRASGIEIAFPGDPAWPDRLDDSGDAPDVLFHQGPGANAPRRRRLAVVGSRNPQAGVAGRVAELVERIALQGLGIVSGAAEGIDEAAHRAALHVGCETWAFMGMALDALDSGRVELVHDIRDAGGTVFSQFPPGARANMSSFTQRNKLISGASDAVLVCQAGRDSGSLHTARAAKEQGRPVLTLPFEAWNEAGEGGNALLREGARMFVDLDDVLDAVGLTGSVSPPEAPSVDVSHLTPTAQAVFGVLARGPADFEGLRAALPELPAGQLAAALVELEVLGAVVHKGGRRYEKR